MCLILFAYQAPAGYRLVLAANRDEFYERPTAPLDFWPDHPHILAGRDLAGSGTWMGVTRDGRLAAITNYRDPAAINPNAPSRGRLVSDFLAGSTPPRLYLEGIHREAHRFNGFNLIVGDSEGLYYYSNYAQSVHQVSSGIHGLSNHLIDAPWPKVTSGKSVMAGLLQAARPDPQSLFKMLTDQTPAPDAQLPDTGVGYAWERQLSPIFIASPGYGTRSSSVLIIDQSGVLDFYERTWRPDPNGPQEEATRHFSLTVTG